MALSAEIVKGIRELATMNDLRELNKLMRDQWAQVQARATLEFRIGEKVWWKQSKWPFDVKAGTVVKVNRTSIKVQVGNMHWMCSPELLTKGEPPKKEA